MVTKRILRNVTVCIYSFRVIFHLNFLIMVCIPCIILPVALWLYNKFLHPYVLKLIPQRWRDKVDNWWYPTCPIKMPPKAAVCDNQTTQTVETKTEDVDEHTVIQNGCAISETGRTVGNDKKTD